MPVDPTVQMLLDGLAQAGGPAMHEQTPAEARVLYNGLAALGKVEEVGGIVDTVAPGPDGDIPVRIYQPAGADGPTGVLVFFHGGGWVIGDIGTHDPVCRWLCSRGGITVVSVDYRLAPEHPFPAAVHDCVAALEWTVASIAEHGGDPTRVAVGGDSAGGNLAAVVAVQPNRPALRYQLLIYPVTDCNLATGSMKTNGEGMMLTADGMEWFVANYLGEHDRSDPLASPLLATNEVIATGPPALVITAEFDPLLDEGEAYGAALSDAGVDTEVVRFDGMIHGFVQLNSMIAKGDEALDLAAARVAAALA